MKKSYFVILFLLLAGYILQSCFSPLGYKETLDEYPTRFTSYFPRTIEGKGYGTFSVLDTTNRCIQLVLYEYVPEVQTRLNEVLVNINPKEVYEADDLNLVTIKMTGDIERGIVSKNFYKSLTINNKIYYPIPYFTFVEFNGMIEKITDLDVFSTETSSGLLDDFQIYILESESGIFWEGLTPLDYMPEGWKNGISKGIAVNKKKNIFVTWFIVW